MSWWNDLWNGNPKKQRATSVVPPPSPGDQVEALLTNRAYDLAARHLGVSSMTGHHYSEVFTLTREKIADYIREHHLAVEDYSANHHWLWLIHEGDRWGVKQFYPPEKCPGEYIDTFYSTEAEARAELFRRVLRNTQTGLYL